MTNKLDTTELISRSIVSGSQALFLFGFFLVLPQFFGMLDLSGRSLFGSYLVLIGILFAFCIHALIASVSLAAVFLKASEVDER